MLLTHHASQTQQRFAIAIDASLIFFGVAPDAAISTLEVWSVVVDLVTPESTVPPAFLCLLAAVRTLAANSNLKVQNFSGFHVHCSNLHN